MTNFSISLRKRLENKRAGKSYLNSIQGEIEKGNCLNEKCIWWMRERDIYFRVTGYADEIVSIDHEGWYTDSYQDGTARGLVVQLPARNGETQYLAGFACTNEDTVCFHLDIWTDKESAAREADRMAERYGEDSCEGEAKESASRQISELEEENKTLLSDIQELHSEWISVAHCGHLLAANTIRETIAEHIAQIKKNRKRIAKLTDNYWESVPA